MGRPAPRQPARSPRSATSCAAAIDTDEGLPFLMLGGVGDLALLRPRQPSRSTATATPLPMFGRYGETRGAADRGRGAARRPGRATTSCPRSEVETTLLRHRRRAPVGPRRATTSACCSSSPKAAARSSTTRSEVGGYPQLEPTRAPFVEADWDLATMDAEIGPATRARSRARRSTCQPRDRAMRSATNERARARRSLALLLAAAPPMVVIDEATTVRREPPPHGAIGMSTAYRISDAVPAAATMEFRRRVLDVGAAIGEHPIAHDEVYYVLSGEGEVVSDGVEARADAGHGRLSLRRRGGRHPPARRRAAGADHLLYPVEVHAGRRSAEVECRNATGGSVRWPPRPVRMPYEARPSAVIDEPPDYSTFEIGYCTCQRTR